VIADMPFPQQFVPHLNPHFEAGTKARWEFLYKPDDMGMRLRNCRFIVEMHQRRPWANGNPGGGSTFHFTLSTAVRS
jgi:light-regulated signal transduction histidine kinase (bacteriophytochrome)